MNTNEIVHALRKEVSNNEASKAVFEVFANRRRARNTITMNSLYHKMRLEGYSYSKADYRPAIELLANLGLGVPVRDKKGRIRLLEGLKLTLQSIGMAALGEIGNVHKLRVKNRFQHLTVPKPEALIEAEDKDTQSSQDNLSLRWVVNGKPIYIQLPKNFTSEDVARLISKLHPSQH